MKYYTRKKLTYEYINSINTLWGGNKMSRFYCRDEELRKLNKRYETTVFKNIGKGKQLYFSAFLCLK